MAGVEETETPDELEPDSLLRKHRALLDQYRERLCSLMSPPEVILQLRRQGVLTKHDQEIILASPSDIERNEAILDMLFIRGPNAFHELVRCLHCFGEKYSSISQTLQPVIYRIVWFATGPTQAAAVVHALESYHDVKFPPLPGNLPSKRKYIVRRAAVFVKWVKIDPSEDNEDTFDCVDNIEVCLIFPTTEMSDYVTETLMSAFKECPQRTVAVMSGVCEGSEREKVVVAKSLIASSSRIDLAHNLVETAQQVIRTQFTPSTKLIQKFTKTQGFSPPTPILDCIDTRAPHPVHSNASYIQMFYEACQQKLNGEIPYLACMGMVKRGGTNKRKLSYSLLSCLTIIEICKILVDALN